MSEEEVTSPKLRTRVPSHCPEAVPHSLSSLLLNIQNRSQVQGQNVLSVVYTEKCSFCVAFWGDVFRKPFSALLTFKSLRLGTDL